MSGGCQQRGSDDSLETQLYTEALDARCILVAIDYFLERHWVESVAYKGVDCVKGVNLRESLRVGGSYVAWCCKLHTLAVSHTCIQACMYCKNKQHIFETWEYPERMTSSRVSFTGLNNSIYSVSTPGCQEFDIQVTQTKYSPLCDLLLLEVQRSQKVIVLLLPRISK